VGGLKHENRYSSSISLTAPTAIALEEHAGAITSVRSPPPFPLWHPKS